MEFNLKHITLVIVFATLSCSLSAQFVVKPGSSITIKEGSSLYVGTTFILESNWVGSAYLADQTTNGSVNITGNVTVKRFIRGNGWHNVSKPVASANTSQFNTTDLVFYYDETKIYNDWNFGWVWYDGALSTMKGYDVYLEENNLYVIYTATNSTGLNTGTYNIDVTLTNVANGEVESHKGWNLIGNPYPSPVDWLVESGWDKNDINDAKYIWNPVADNYTIFLGGSNPVGVNGGTQYIPSNQGFWVQATTNGNISVNNSARKAIISSTPDYYKNSNSSYPLISLVASGNSLSDETIIRFIENTSNGFDRNYDASKLYSGSLKVPQISTSSNNLEFAINTYPKIIDNSEIPLNFWCATSGHYCLELGENSNTNSINSIYLFDKFNKQFVNLSTERKYCFDHNNISIKQRFAILINPSNNKMISLKTASPFLVYSNNKNINISCLLTEKINAEVQIVNLMGQIVYSKTINDYNTNIVLHSGSGYYIVRIISQDGQFNTKIFIP